MQKSLRPIFSLLLGVAFLLAGSGVQFTLLPLHGSHAGFGDVALGFIASAYYVGFVSGCLGGPYLILRAGHIRAFTAMVALATALALAYALVPTPLAWLMFRFLTGFCLAGLYLVIESWLNDRAGNENRGLVMSAYIIVNFGALTIAQMLVTLYPVGDAGNFMVAAIICALAIVPVAMTRSAQPAPITIVSFRPGALYRAAPVALVAAFMTGLANGAFWGLGPLAAAGAGLDTGGVAAFMSLALFAGAVAQWPAGRVSDRVDRRKVLLALLLAAAAAGFALWWVSASGRLLLGFGVAFGALSLPCYAIAAAHGYDKTPASDMVPTAATILMASGLGSVLGPLIGSVAMAVLGPWSLFLVTAAAQLLLAGYVLYRTQVQASLAPPDKTEFDIATASLVGGVVTPETLDPADPSVAVPEPYVPEQGEAPAAPSTE